MSVSSASRAAWPSDPISTGEGAAKERPMTILPDGKLYIDGKLRDATGGKTYEDIG